SNARWALMHELRTAPEATVEELIAHMTPVDLLLIEGFKSHAHPKLEVHRPALGKPLLCTDDPHVVAIATDAPVPSVAAALRSERHGWHRRFHRRPLRPEAAAYRLGGLAPWPS